MVKELPPYIKRVPPLEDELKIDFDSLKESIKNGDKKLTLQSLKDARDKKIITKEQYDELHEEYTLQIELKNQRLEEVLHIDTLTGLSTDVESSLDGLINELNPPGPEHRESTIDAIGFVYLDLNKFKNVNDTYGHLVGDQALFSFVERMKSVVKRTDIIFRSNRRGDEFAIIFPIKNDRTDEALEKLFKRLYKKVNDNFVIYKDAKPIHLSASMGYTVLRKGETATAQELIDRADKKMYVDKHKDDKKPEAEQ